MCPANDFHLVELSAVGISVVRVSAGLELCLPWSIDRSISQYLSAGLGPIEHRSELSLASSYELNKLPDFHVNACSASLGLALTESYVSHLKNPSFLSYPHTALDQCAFHSLMPSARALRFCLCCFEARPAFSTGGFDVISGGFHIIAVADRVATCALDFGAHNAAWGIQNVLFFRIEGRLKKPSQQVEFKRTMI